MMRILWTLEHTHRYVVTNMVLFLDEIQDYLDARKIAVNVRHRVLFLTDVEQMRNFWLYRDHGLVLPTPNDYSVKGGKDNVSYDPILDDPRFWLPLETSDGVPVLRGTLYVIDEVHTLFPARGWQGTPRHADFYNSQHAKLNDEVIFITQNTKLVDPNFYRLAQDFHYCRNHRLMKHGRFKGANKFTAHIHDGPATTGTEPTLNIEEFTLDLEVAKCYDTSAGVGMRGGGAADSSARAKGIPLWTVWAAVVFAIVVVYWFFNYQLPKFSNKYLTSAIKSGSLNPDKALPSSASKPAAKSLPLVAGASPLDLGFNLPPYPIAPLIADTKPTLPLSVRGYVVRGSRVNVVLSDGRVLTEKTGEIQAVDRSSVRLRNGAVLYLLTPNHEIEQPQPIESPQPTQTPKPDSSQSTPLPMLTPK